MVAHPCPFRKKQEKMVKCQRIGRKAVAMWSWNNDFWEDFEE
jgi:hypothetical protein